ncbi:DUF4912 domain-containing protein [Neobacillus sp. Marseille-QA0830]
MINKSDHLTQQLHKKETATGDALLPLFQPPINNVKMKLVSPNEIAIFWDPSDLPQKMIGLFFGIQFEDLVHVVRIYDVTDLVFTGHNAHHFYELAIPYQNGFWHVKGLAGKRSYVSEIGVYLKEDEYFPFFRSNSLLVPESEKQMNPDSKHGLPPVKPPFNVAPKWHDYVSTYSYYRNKEDQHD